MARKKRCDGVVFTTGEAAHACRLSQQTIIRCVDAGDIKAFRVPGSRFRRIPRVALVEWMERHGIPTDLLPPVGGWPEQVPAAG